MSLVFQEPRDQYINTKWCIALIERLQLLQVLAATGQNEVYRGNIYVQYNVKSKAVLRVFVMCMRALNVESF